MTTDLITTMFAACKCEVSITVNSHRNMYETVAEFLDAPSSENVDISEDVRAEMIARDTIIDIQAYKDTPVGFYRVIHWDLVTALQQMLDTLNA